MLNEKIKSLRTALGMSQVELAKRLGVSKQCVCNWENDNILPSIELLCKLADELGVTPDFLLDYNEKKSIDVTGLSDQQIAHIRLIISDLKDNK